MTNKNSITDSNNNFTPVTDNADSISSMRLVTFGDLSLKGSVKKKIQSGNLFQISLMNIQVISSATGQFFFINDYNQCYNQPS